MDNFVSHLQFSVCFSHETNQNQVALTAMSTQHQTTVPDLEEHSQKSETVLSKYVSYPVPFYQVFTSTYLAIKSKRLTAILY